MHQEQNPKKHITIDSIRELRELTEIKIKSDQSGLLMVGGVFQKILFKILSFVLI